jgi:hypothetical protein
LYQPGKPPAPRLPHAAACCRLIAAIIAQAVCDATKPLTKDELRGRTNIDADAKQAMRFLFNEDTNFPRYAKLIGMSADQLRANLSKPRDQFEVEPRVPIFGWKKRRMIRLRLQFGNF